MVRVAPKKPDVPAALLAAAKKVLRSSGYAGFSTREVAAAAGVPLSQIHYHFGSKTKLILALFERQNQDLMSRQRTMFDDTSIPLSERWDRACAYFDEDIASGYVRTLQELIAASWSDSDIAPTIQKVILGWHTLLSEMASRVGQEIDLSPFTPEEVGALVANAFMGAESMYLLGVEKRGYPVRDSLRRIADLIRRVEGHSKLRR